MSDYMTKEDLSKLLKSLGCAVNEGITSDENQSKYPRIVYWPYVEKDVVASGEGYVNLVTYQISIFDRVPQSQIYKNLRKLLRKKGFTPEFYHEYIEEDPIFKKAWHTYFSLDVLEEIEDEENE